LILLLKEKMEVMELLQSILKQSNLIPLRPLLQQVLIINMLRPQSYLAMEKPSKLSLFLLFQRMMRIDLKVSKSSYQIFTHQEPN
jgi:hypothetical protein